MTDRDDELLLLKRKKVSHDRLGTSVIDESLDTIKNIFHWTSQQSLNLCSQMITSSSGSEVSIFLGCSLARGFSHSRAVG